MKLIGLIFLLFSLFSCDGGKLSSTLFLSGGGSNNPIGPGGSGGTPGGGTLDPLPPGQAAPTESKDYFIAYEDTNQILIAYIDGNKTAYKAGDFPEGANVTSMASLNGKVYFSVEELGDLSSLGGSEIWVFDPATRSLSMGIDINPNGNGNPDFLTVYNDELYFRGNNGTAGNELMKLSGSSATVVSDISAGAASSDPAQLTVVGNTLYFVANANNAVRLYAYNGTSSQEITGGYSLPKFLVEHNNTLYFSAGDGRLYRVNGTAAELVLTLNVVVGQASMGDNKWLASFNGNLYFAGYGSMAIGAELYKLNGTTATLVSDIYPGGQSSKPSHLIANNKLYFQARTAEGVELWMMDANENLSSQDISTNDNDGSYPQNFFMLGDQLVFSAKTKDAGFELWKIQGDKAGLWYDINPGGASSYPAKQASLFE